MSGFVLVSHAPEAAATTRSKALRRQADDQGLRIIDLSPQVWLGAYGPRPPRTLAVGAWTLIGDVFNRARHPFSPSPAGDTYEHKMIARFWGRYVGARLNGRGELDAVLRDPSGAFECVTWRQGGLTLVVSETPEWLIQALRPNWCVDYDRVRAVLQDPLSAWSELSLEGPTALLPGSLHELNGPGPPVDLWRPGGIARADSFDGVDDSVAAMALSNVVDEVVSGYGRLDCHLGAEVSGGLDSSIAAASLRTVSTTDVRLWLNAYGPDPEADEREFAQALAAKIGIEIAFAPRRTGLISEADLMAISGYLRPGLNALDMTQDQDWAARWRDAGVTAVMTGKGGDSVFVQAATGDVFSDLWRSRGWRAAFSPHLAHLARSDEKTVWSLIQKARRARQGEAGVSRSNNILVPRDASRSHPVHPWMRDAEGLGPAKQYQIAGVLNGLTFQAPSAQTEVADLLHPLLAQPVVETCLALSTPRLTLGRSDRALARLAFRDRLPDVITARRSKGEMTAFYGHRIADSLDVLRPWLLDGLLAARGLIDREATERLLTREQLIWRGGYGDIMIAAAVEGWVRVWASRLSAR